MTCFNKTVSCQVNKIKSCPRQRCLRCVWGEGGLRGGRFGTRVHPIQSPRDLRTELLIKLTVHVGHSTHGRLYCALSTSALPRAMCNCRNWFPITNYVIPGFPITNYVIPGEGTHVVLRRGRVRPVALRHTEGGSQVHQRDDAGIEPEDEAAELLRDFLHDHRFPRVLARSHRHVCGCKKGG